jgi:hypothetical protein
MLWEEINYGRITRWRGTSEAAACSVTVRGLELAPFMCSSLSMPLEKFDQVPTLSHTKFCHSEWQHLRELWRQGKFCFSSMAVGPKRFSYFLNFEYDIRDWVEYIYVFIFQVVGQCDTESVTGCKEDWPQ